MHKISFILFFYAGSILALFNAIIKLPGFFVNGIFVLWKDELLLLLCGTITICLASLHLIQFKRRRKQSRCLDKNIPVYQRSEAMVSAEEQEKKRIVTRLHDGVGQMMSVAKMGLSKVHSNTVFRSPEDRAAFENAMALVDKSCVEVKKISDIIISNILMKKGLCPAIYDFISRVDGGITKINFYCEGLQARLELNLEIVLYRIIQESILNAITHASARHLEISLTRNDYGIAATIEDDGKGFDPWKAENPDAIGLSNIRARVNYLRGHVEFDSSPGKGTLVAIHIPLTLKGTKLIF